MSTGRVAYVNLGCRVNRVELDGYVQELLGHGVVLTSEEDAQVVLVNTCAVTGEAEAKARKAVRHAATLPSAPSVVATGCVASLFSAELEEIAPNVRVVANKSNVVDAVLEELPQSCDKTPSQPAPTSSVTATGRARPGIKIQDGCDNRCTYCIVWKARGVATSQNPSLVIDEVRSEIDRGASEVVLTGINLGRWTWDDASRHMGLADLLSRILDETDVGRVRLSSIEPPETTRELLEVMASSNGRIAPFLHLALQSGCSSTLERMGRTYTAGEYAAVVSLAREVLPGVAIACDLIVGFPGETDAEFDESLSFCREMAFAKMHVFRYSRRPGTPAAVAPSQVDPHVAARRSAVVRALSEEMRENYALSRVGEREHVLVERPGRGTTGGLLEASVSPSVPVGTFADGRVTAVLPGHLLLVGD